MKTKKFDIVTILGLFVALFGLGFGFYLEGGNFSALVAPSPILIIFGGTIGATLITMNMDEVKNIPRVIKKVFEEEAYDYHETIDQLCEWARISRRDGIVKLGEIAEEVEDPFMRRGLEYILEGNDFEAIKELLNVEIEAMEQRHERGRLPFEEGGGFAPTLGIIGAVLGLVVVLGGLGSKTTEELGHGISTAFLATLMGLAFANLVLLPFASKLKAKSENEILYKQIVLEGILSIQTGQNPKTLRKKLIAFLPENLKERKSEGSEQNEA